MNLCRKCGTNMPPGESTCPTCGTEKVLGKDSISAMLAIIALVVFILWLTACFGSLDFKFGSFDLKMP